MGDNTPKSDLPNEPMSNYDDLPAAIRKVIREADDEWECGPLLKDFGRRGMTAADYADMLRRILDGG